MVNYNNFSKTFSNSRKNMKWEEVDYFLSFLKWFKKLKIIDIWCGSGRLLSELKDSELDIKSYLWIDLSSWLLDEAKKKFEDDNFIELNMLNVDKVDFIFDTVFLIASFHHINNLEDRLRFFKKLYKKLETWDMLFLTNWSLESDLNRDRYISSKIKWTTNKFWSSDFNIKIWAYTRYYHCFSLDELNYIFTKTWFQIIENREFDNKRNIISIIKKIWD